MDKDLAWENILKVVQEQVSPANFKTWFSNTKLVDLTDSALTLAVASAFVKEQLVLRYSQILEDSIKKVLEHFVKLEYVIDSSLNLKPKSKKAQDDEDGEFILTAPSSGTQGVGLNQKYTFESFVVGLTNNLAFAAAQAVVQSPGSTYNPLFIHGPSGVGKTHLMHAIGNAMYKKNPHLKIISAPSEKFMNDFVESIQNKTNAKFRYKYRDCDLFLVDDVQFISGKDSTQEEFFHTFNELYTKGAQVVLTSDRPPNEIQKLESRLASRFQGGLMVDIQLPDFDTRVAILKAKLIERGEVLPEDILKAIAEVTQSNTRELEGKLIQILSALKISGQSANLENIQRFLGVIPRIAKSSALDHKKVLLTVNNYFNIKMADLTGPRRQKELVTPRQIVMYILYSDCKIPMERIGDILGGRDHTTVLHGIRKIEDSIKRDREVQRVVIELRQALS